MTDKTLAEEIAGWPKMPHEGDGWTHSCCRTKDAVSVRLATCVRVMKMMPCSHIDYKTGAVIECPHCTLLSALKEEGL